MALKPRRHRHASILFPGFSRAQEEFLQAVRITHGRPASRGAAKPQQKFDDGV